MGRTLTGSTSNIESLGRKDIMSFIEMNYKAPRMVLTSVGGQVDLEKLAETAERNLGGMKNLTERNVDSEYYPKHFTELSGQSKDGVGYQQNPQQLLQQQDLLPLGSLRWRSSTEMTICHLLMWQWVSTAARTIVQT